MEKKQKINAKKFLEDFRAGKSESELMSAHGLTQANLDKVFRALIDKNLLDKSEVDRLRQPEPEVREPLPYPEPLDWASHSAEMRRLAEEQGVLSSFCPQCGAKISKKMLTCPECGHIIPGHDRWAEAEPKTSFVQSLSPKTVGCILAFPVLVILFFFFKNIILPMAETVGEKRAQAVRKEMPKGKTPMEAAKDLAKELSTKTIRAEVQRYIDDEILASAKEDFSAFTVGPRWGSLTVQEKETFVQEISLSMEGSSLKKDFRLVGPSGKTVAKVVDGAAMWRDGTELVLPHTPRVTDEARSEPDLSENPVQRAFERGFPGGGDLITEPPRQVTSNTNRASKKSGR